MATAAEHKSSAETLAASTATDFAGYVPENAPGMLERLLSAVR